MLLGEGILISFVLCHEIARRTICLFHIRSRDIINKAHLHFCGEMSLFKVCSMYADFNVYRIFLLPLYCTGISFNSHILIYIVFSYVMILNE